MRGPTCTFWANLTPFSLKGWGKTGGCGCMNTVGDGLDEDCNCIYMPYGDGASFSGYRAKPWPVPGTKVRKPPSWPRSWANCSLP